jgi:hypothetical protein
MALSEVNARVKERLWLLVVLIATLIAGARADVGLISRQQRLRFYRESEERYRSTHDGMLEGCQIIDLDFRYAYVF